MTVHDCSVASGTRLGPYEIVSFIAAGGMGEVYEARDTRLNRRVAIKVLPAAYGTDRDRLARFEKEARSASQLAHPNIISVYDVGEEADLPYIVTELLEGRTLATALHERRLSINEALDIAIQVARGLAAAHEKRIVHRDLKPANIYITTAGHVKILDFGLAKLTEEEWQPGTSEETKSLISRPGLIVGSAAYMSPEQVQGAAADLRSDIFSFGSILYEMVTGRRPFRGNSPIETMSAILRDEPPPISPTDCAPEVTALVNRCLAKRPDGRFPTGAELLFALQQTALMGPAGMVRPASAAPRAGSRSARRKFAAALLVATLSLLVSGGSRSRAGGVVDDGTSIRVSRIERLTTDGLVGDALISPDGVFLAYTTQRQKAVTSHLRHIGSGSDIELFPPREDRFFSTAGFSPDGNYVYLRQFALAGTAHRGSPLWDPQALVRVPLLGGTPEPVLSGWFSKLLLAPNGTRVAFVRHEKDGSRSRVVIADPYLKSERVVAELAGDVKFTGDPAWSADSHHVVVAVYDDRPNGNNQPMEIDVDTRATRRLPLCAQIDWATSIQSAPGGSWIVQSGLSESRLWHVSSDGSRCRQLTDNTASWQIGGATSDGSTVVAIGTQEMQNIWRASIGDKEPPMRITQGINTADGGAGGLAVFADGRIVFTRNASGNIGGKPHVWILDRSGNMRQLTRGETDESHLAASPDGHTIAYTAAEYDAKKNSHSQLWVMDVDSGESRPLASAPVLLNSSFSPDGAAVYYVDYPGGYPARLKRVAITGGPPVDITPRTGCDRIRVSPDGKMLACLEKGTVTIASMADGSVFRTFVLPRWAMNMRFLPDSSALAYVQFGVDMSDVWTIAVHGGEPRRIAHLTGELIDGYAFLPDGQGFVCSRAADLSDAFLLRLESAPSTTTTTR